MCCTRQSAQGLKLSSREKDLIRTTWADITLQIEEVGVESFLNLFSTHTNAKDSFLIFKETDIKDLSTSALLKSHSLKVTNFVNKCIIRLENHEAVAKIAVELGMSHLANNVTEEYMNTLKDSYINAIAKRCRGIWSRETRLAWDKLFDFIVHNMQVGIALQKQSLQKDPRLK